MPAIDFAKGVDQFGGDESMYMMMLERFEGLTLTDSLSKLNQAMASREWQEVRRQAHSLKGASGYIAAEKFSHTAFELQQAAESGDESRIKSAHSALSREADILLKEIHKLLGKLGQ
eukprot:GILJ01002045.1.p1 GENE.GILJ01002045.1~~GILJ01002045.1.p1  ORF type:complete len:117 (+),score=17.86 GILJ01002045.1:95-445(+)